MFCMVTMAMATTADGFLNAHGDDGESKADGQSTEEYIASTAPFSTKPWVVPPGFISEIKGNVKIKWQGDAWFVWILRNLICLNNREARDKL